MRLKKAPSTQGLLHLALILAALTTGCSIHHGKPMATEPLTLGAEGWRAYCQTQVHKALEEPCEALEGASGLEGEKIAFTLNVKASDLGITARGLRDLHFSRGRYAGWSVADVAAAMDGGSGSGEPLLDLAVGVNRAFPNGKDSGVLSKWVTTPLCASDGSTEGASIEGPEATRCGLLDTECTRGTYRSKEACCSMRMAPAGALCQEGVCDGRGRCQSRPGPPSGLGRPLTWLEAPAGDNPRAWHMQGENTVRLSIATDEEVLEFSTASSSGNVPFEQWQPRPGSQWGRPVADVDAQELGKERIRLGHIARKDGNEPGITATAIHVPGGAQRLFLAGEVADVCLVKGRALDDLGPLLSDCSLPGAIRLPCPGSTQDARCTHQDGRTEIEGDDLIIAFEAQILPTEVLVDLFPGQTCIAVDCIGTPDGPLDRIGFDDIEIPRACDFGGGCFGEEICFEFRGRRNCFCYERRERCDGADNDCDGEIDEDVDAQCDDGIACTGHLCEGERGCVNFSPDQNSGACMNNYCAKGVCNGQLPTWADPSWTRTATDGNGCSLSFDDGFCENIWDRCECNGNSVCDPTAAAMEDPTGLFAAVAGCSEISPRAIPIGSWPCEATGDNNACTDEICCEPNPQCRLFFATTPPSNFDNYSYRIVPSTAEECTNPIAPRRGAGGPTNPSAATSCVRVEDGASAVDRMELYCSDGNPCTFDQCSNFSRGICSNAPLGAGGTGTTQPFPLTATLFGQFFLLDDGCRDDPEQECGMKRCVFDPFSMSSTCTSDPGQCDDGLECTVDNCASIEFGICDHLGIVPGQCLIEGVCYSAGDLRDDCHICAPDLDVFDWTLISDPRCFG